MESPIHENSCIPDRTEAIIFISLNCIWRSFELINTSTESLMSNQTSIPSQSSRLSCRHDPRCYLQELLTTDTWTRFNQVGFPPDDRIWYPESQISAKFYKQSKCRANYFIYEILHSSNISNPLRVTFDESISSTVCISVLTNKNISSDSA